MKKPLVIASSRQTTLHVVVAAEESSSSHQLGAQQEVARRRVRRPLVTSGSHSSSRLLVGRLHIVVAVLQAAHSCIRVLVAVGELVGATENSRRCLIQGRFAVAAAESSSPSLQQRATRRRCREFLVATAHRALQAVARQGTARCHVRRSASSRVGVWVRMPLVSSKSCSSSRLLIGRPHIVVSSCFRSSRHCRQPSIVNLFVALSCQAARCYVRVLVVAAGGSSWSLENSRRFKKTSVCHRVFSSGPFVVASKGQSPRSSLRRVVHHEVELLGIA